MLPRRISRRRFLRWPLAAAGAGTGVAGLGGYAFWIEPRWLEVVRLAIAIPNLPAPFHGLCVAHLTDLHLGPAVPREYVATAVDAALAARPDLVVLTGDYVSALDGGEAAALVAEASRLAAPLGVYAVYGNHDYWTDQKAVAAALGQAGVALLRNDAVALGRGGATLYLVGVDDALEGRADLEAALRAVPADGCAVLLAHEPDFAEEAARDSRVALQLSGHSHGGQVGLLGVPLVLPMLARKYPRGLYRVGGMQLYTNRGVGLIRPPARLGCRPEVALVTLARA